MTKKIKLIIISIISALAFFNASYLSYDWIFSTPSPTSLYFPVWNITSWWSFCDINETLSCSAVLQDPGSQIFWIPFPVIAMLVYPIIFLISIFGIIWKIRKNVFKILLAMWVWWILFNWYFIFQEIFYIWAFCPLCLLCSLIIITIASISFSEVIKK